MCYLIARDSGIQERSLHLLAESEKIQSAYIKEAASTSTADEISKLAELRDKGVLTEEELTAQKAKLLA